MKIAVGSKYVFATLAAFIVGCGVTDKMNNMNDKTTDMADTTHRMADTTNKMNGGMEKQLDVSFHMKDGMDRQLDISKEMKAGMDQQLEISKTMNAKMDETLRVSEGISKTALHTYYDMRIGSSKDARNKLMNRLVSNDEMPIKLESASSYVYSFEYQFWKGEGEDTPEKLESMKTLAIKEFFENLLPFEKSVGIENSSLPGVVKSALALNNSVAEFTGYKLFDLGNEKPLNKTLLNAYALAATCHYVYPDQAARAKQMDFKPVSIYSMIEEGLRTLQTDPNADPAKLLPHVAQVQHFSNYAIKLLQNRLTYLALHTYAEMSGMGDLPQHAQAFQAMLTRFGQWKPNIYSYNPSQIYQFNIYFSLALQTRKLLSDLGVDDNLNNELLGSLSIRTLWGTINAKMLKSPISGDTAADQKKVQAEKFQVLLNLLLNSSEDFKKADPQLYSL